MVRLELDTFVKSAMALSNASALNAPSPSEVCGDITGVGFDCLGVIRDGAVDLLIWKTIVVSIF